MSDDISFDRKFTVPSGRLDDVAPQVRRIVAPNASPFTFTGTCSYIVGRGQVAIIDPGPDDPAHVAALLDAVRGETVTHIVITHTHRDHSPAAVAIKAATGAITVGEGPHRPSRPLHIGEINTLDASGDMDFVPEIVLADGEAVTGPGWTLEAVATPGHTANHFAFALPEDDLLFSGDHVMAWATTIVAPPDGAMGDYVRSLKKLAARSEPLYLPGHGGPVQDAPALVRGYLDHRRARETAILRGLERNTTVADLVRGIYIGLDPRLVGAASLTVLAHLEDMVEKKLVRTEGPPSIDGVFTLVK
ncbi:MBL fold metallo-hydrolase [Azorhizobium oxalatiphilum]|uniref:MBL fold metallo-hydrolase n=1 Tax=Azorhizobium oxalatiphilum TaxID=980631 RepID=A0A917FJ60_9HYPH|nr:MBL fold metallo-hydrolase [Azorhizobium oxalatiphilum]GGF82788.1 MBL fold metallo-hydrolase [Azorhizobium oxalatiphilum]